MNNKRNDSSHAIKKIILTTNLKSSKLSLSENNIKKPCNRSSRQNYNKVIRKIKPYKFVKYKFLKNFSNILKNKVANENNNIKIHNINSFFFKFNQNNRNLFFSQYSKNNNIECNNDNNEINNDNNNSNINLSTDITSNKNLKNNIKLLPIKPINGYGKIKNKKKNLSSDIRVNKIINSLINPKSEDDEYYKKSDSYFKKEENNKNYYPKEKMIDPIYYIKYNLNTPRNPKEKPLYKGINKIIKEITKGYSNKEYSINLLKRSREISNRKIEIKHLNVPNSENNIYKKKYEDMLNQTKHCKSFHFNKNDFYQNKLKQYSPYKSVLDRTYKFYFDNQIKDKQQDIEETNRNWSKRNIKLNLKKSIDKYLSFDTRVNNILRLSKNTEKNVNEKSKVHEKMINEINKIIKTY